MIPEFLSAIWGDSYPYGELRPIRDGEVKQFYFGLISLPGALLPTLIDEYAYDLDREGYDIYYGVLPRVRKGGTDADAMPTTRILWQDIDIKHIEGGHLAALMNLQRSGLDPSILVDSGNGLHAYHLLDNAVHFDRARAAMKGMAGVVGGDHTYNASRVLRLPGTRNHKTDPPKPVRLLHFDPSRRYNISDFDRFIEPEGPPRRKTDLKRDWETLPEWLVDLIESGAPDGQRSESCFKAMLWLIRYGWGRDDIHELFLRTPYGIGEKMAEKGRGGESWFGITYRSAESAA